MRVSTAILSVALLLSGRSSAAVLSATDANLGRVNASAIEAGLRITVDLGDDLPTAAHIIARFQNNQPLMRGADGLWAPWNGDPLTLDDVAATPGDGKLTFHIFESVPDGLFYPVSFTVVYRTRDGLKSGTLTMDGP